MKEDLVNSFNNQSSKKTRAIIRMKTYNTDEVIFQHNSIVENLV